MTPQDLQAVQLLREFKRSRVQEHRDCIGKQYDLIIEPSALYLEIWLDSSSLRPNCTKGENEIGLRHMGIAGSGQ